MPCGGGPRPVVVSGLRSFRAYATSHYSNLEVRTIIVCAETESFVSSKLQCNLQLREEDTDKERDNIIISLSGVPIRRDREPTPTRIGRAGHSLSVDLQFA